MKPILYIVVMCFMTLSSVAQLQPVKSGIYKWAELPVKMDAEREVRSVFKGTCPRFKSMEIHATTQKQGAKPRPAHANEDREELIIVKEGKLKVTIGAQSAVLGAGSIVLLLPQEMHTLENIGDGPLTYYVMRYQSEKPMDLERGKAGGGSIMLNKDSLQFKPSAKGGGRAYFNRPTAMCENFEMHVTQLNKKGPSHAAHTHTDNEIILAIEGNTEINIDGKAYNGNAGDLYFIPSASLHNAGNADDVPCMYFAIRWR
jgi:(S)-ureidoglycine aminohydrolase